MNRSASRIPIASVFTLVTLANSIGACSIKMTIKPKKVGRMQPASIIKTFDVMVRR